MAEDKTYHIIDRKDYRPKFRKFMNENNESMMKVMTINRENKISFGHIIESHAIEYADNIAILFEDKSLTYKEYNEVVNQYAHYFISLGLKKGDTVDLLMKNRIEFLIILGAIGKIGALLSLVNADQREQSLLHSISITLGDAILVGEESLDSFEAIRGQLELTNQKLLFSPDLGEVPCPADYINVSEAIKGFPKDNPSTTQDMKTHDQFLYIFTSGTTGLPKAAYFPHQRLVVAGLFMGQVLGQFTSDDILYLTTPLFHSNSITAGFGAMFGTGGTLALARKFSASRFWDDTRKYKATAFNYVGELCRYLLNQPPKPDDVDNTVKTIIGNGLRPEMWMDFKKRFGIERVAEFYGATEAGGMFSNWLNYDLTCGYNQSVYAIVEYDIEEDMPVRNEKGRMNKVPPGEAGLLLFPYNPKSGLFVGYKDKKATEAKLYHDVLKEGDTWINTGDMVRNQGCNHAMFVDRLGDTFRWKGHNVSTTEVERIFNDHDQILLASVYPVQIPGTDGRAGMGAFTASVSVEEFDFKTLSEQLLKNLPPYAVPIFLRFKSELSTTSTFKLKKSTLKKESFNLEDIDDILYLMLPGEKEYTPLTKEIYEDIQNGKYKF
jgi:fatty-acyl-CoA synthase/citronellyl-CoA synthetase